MVPGFLAWGSGFPKAMAPVNGTRICTLAVQPAPSLLGLVHNGGH
jgi:hypothetical protein